MKIKCLPLGAMQVNCLLIQDEQTNIGAVIDPADNAKEILRMCQIEGIELKYILLTHAHFDHMLALEELREATGVPLALHRLEAASLLDPNITYMAQFAKGSASSKPAEILLSDGDTITLGNTELTVMHTPGHTVGSVCYCSGDILITGDTLFMGTVGRCDLFGGDEHVLMESLKRLSMLEGDYTVYPGHGPITTLSNEKNYNIYLKHL